MICMCRLDTIITYSFTFLIPSYSFLRVIMVQTEPKNPNIFTQKFIQILEQNYSYPALSFPPVLFLSDSLSPVGRDRDMSEDD